MIFRWEVAAAGGKMNTVPLAAVVLAFGCLLAARSQVPSALPSITAYSCFEHFYELLESVVVLGSPAQWMVALLGLCLYPALSRTGRVVGASNAGAVGSSTPSNHDSARLRGPGSHSIKLEHHTEHSNQTRGTGNGFFKRLRRVLSDGRAQARRLCGQDNSLRNAMTSLSRKRSFGSRSSKSEDVLSSRLSMDTVMRAAQQSTGGSGRRGLLQRKTSGGGRWQPSMSRIASGQHLAGMAASDSSLSSVAAGKRLEILSYNGFQAVDCMSHEMTDPIFEAVRQVVTDTHLLQFGALIGEASAELALSQAGSPAAVSAQPDSLFGSFDRTDLYRQGWEPVVEEHKPGLHYWTWRRHLRKGLFMYKSKTVYETATTAQIVDFTYDTEFRRTWDDSMACQVPIPAPAGGAEGALVSLAEAEAKSAVGKSSFMYARTKFPPPMASREYTYVRRCWSKPDDGGCYCISRAFAHPSPPPAGCRTVRVTDFVSGYVIRSSKGVFDTANPAVEVVNVYFEDPCVPSGIVNMGIRRALWPMVQKAEAAFRDYLLTRVYGNLEQPPPERAVAMDSLGAAMGAEGAHAARAAAADADAASCMGGLPLSFGRSWKLVSPYVLLYSGYVATWRGGRSAMLSLLSCCMSLWCNATGLFVGALGAGRTGVRATAAAAQALLAAVSRVLIAACSGPVGNSKGLPAAARAGHVLARVLWPWDALARRGRRGEASAAGHPGLQRSTSNSSSGGDRLSSHPLPGSGAAAGMKRLSFCPRTSCGGAVGSDGTQSPRGPRRGRGGFARRCAMLAVKVAKVAGAGLLLGRAARTDGSGAAETSAATAQQPRAQGQALQPQRVQGQALQQPRRPPPLFAVKRASDGQDW